MKVSILSLVVLACTLLSSTCKKEPLTTIKEIKLNAVFELKLNEKALISHTNILLELTEINDSRCPVDVQCIWAGNARVKLNVKGLETSDAVLSFCIGQCDNGYHEADTLAIRYQNQAYTIILSEVNPYPGKGAENKVAVFTIKKE